jgi:hypothetical protein|tara:strand:+ start:1502 stop:1717 length:216 start_codon:yes stop_codon:yes gene_type:complete
MTQQDYRSLLILVNTKDQYHLLKEYASKRIETLLAQISTETDMDRVKRIQGSVAELRRIKTLRDEVIAGAK